MAISIDFFKICGIAVICALLLTLLKKSFGGTDTLLRVGGGVVIFSLMLSGLGEAVGAVMEITSSIGGENALLSSSFSLMLKALGIAVISKLCSDVCRDCGESGLAGGIEAAGRVAIISMCIPIVRELVGLAVKILEMGE